MCARSDASRTDVPAGTSVAGGLTARTTENTTVEEPKTQSDPEDVRFMGLALDEARKAAELDEVPVGAIVVHDGLVLAAGHNLINTRNDPTAHAEIIAVSTAARERGYARLLGATVYTTVEPCFMCAGALVLARVARVVWGVRDPKFGGCVSLGRTLDDPRLNHRASFTEGVRADEARELLQSFFRSKRGATRGI